FGNYAGPLYQDHNGNLWVASQTGLWRWTPGAPKRYEWPHGVTTAFALAEDDSGKLLLGTINGLKQLLNGEIQIYPLPGITGQFLPELFFGSGDGGLWIGTTEGWLHVHRGRVDLFSAIGGLSADFVYRIFEDREGSIWIGTADGLDRFREYPIP